MRARAAWAALFVGLLSNSSVLGGFVVDLGKRKFDIHNSRAQPLGEQSNRPLLYRSGARCRLFEVVTFNKNAELGFAASSERVGSGLF